MNKFRILLPAAAVEYKFSNKKRLVRDVKRKYQRYLMHLHAGLMESGYAIPNHWHSISVNTAYHCLTGYYEHLERRGTIETIGPVNV